MPSIRDKKDEILRLYKQGMSVSSLADRIGVQTSAVAAFLARSGIRPRLRMPDRLLPTTEREVAKLYARGTSSTEIIRRFGIDRTTVLNIVRRHGGTVRSRGSNAREFTKSELRAMKARWLRGESQVSLAKHFATCQSVVSRVLRQSGVKPDPRVSGQAHGRWKRGRISAGGYWRIHVGHDHAFKSMVGRDGYVLEHRWVLAKKLGRPIREDETVHHIDGDRANNEPDNLQLRVGHHGKHVSYCCGACGSRNIVPVQLD